MGLARTVCHVFNVTYSLHFPPKAEQGILSGALFLCAGWADALMVVMAVACGRSREASNLTCLQIGAIISLNICQ